MPRFPICRYGFFLFLIFFPLFFLCPQPAFCLDSIRTETSLEADDNKDEALSNDETWEEEWEKNDESSDDTEGLWAEREDTRERDKNEGLFKLSGEVRNKFAHDVSEDNDSEDDIMNHARLRVGASLVHGDRLRAALFANINYFSYGNDGDWEEDADIRLDDAYLNFRGDGFNLKLGNQVIRWGKTDAYSPLDNLNPEDLRDDLSGRREDRKLPIPMAGMEIYAGKFTISGVFIPFFVKSEYDLIGTDWALLGHTDEITLKEESSSDSLKNSEGGIRLSGIAGRLDWAFSWLYAREDLPTPDSLDLPVGFPFSAGNVTTSQLADFLNATGQSVMLTHDRQNIFGFEFETTLHSFGVRGDLAYIDHASYFTRDLQRIRKPVVQLMTGIDYSGVNDWYANIQLFISRIQDYESRIIWATETTRAINGTLWKEFFNGDFRMECRYYYELSGDATVLNPKLRLSFWNPIIFEIGGEWFDGSNETIPGRYKYNDQVYLTAEIKF
ncbi:MAG: hypothetical protein PHG14_15320 [Desulfobacter postgatei]|uniref:DUF1302 family protein n=1 Tax=Desulfobacter postgatei TaxID=2293 RepID=UPI0023F493BC|nr:DUF1302 family protein [Desulfobacter postgatei]MDD4275084.1 hypothetical protein [Desulfobacter postgatei]